MMCHKFRPEYDILIETRQEITARDNGQEELERRPTLGFCGLNAQYINL